MKKKKKSSNIMRIILYGKIVDELFPFFQMILLKS
jgi:hypothetical protein